MTGDRQLLITGTTCLVRLSLAAQRALLRAARAGQPIPDDVRRELEEIDEGAELLRLCGGRLDLDVFMWLLVNCDPWLADRVLMQEPDRMALLLAAAPQGYRLRETAPVMLSPDLEATMAWFEQTLGWGGGCDERDQQGRCTFGSLLWGSGEAVSRRVRPFNGLHLAQGKPPAARYPLAMLYVDGLALLRERVLASGWEQISALRETSWNTRICELTTCDGYELRLFEWR